MSNTLNSHRENPRKFSKPVFINATASLEHEGSHYQLFLDINNKLKVTEVGYLVEGKKNHLGELSYFLEKIEGQYLQDIFNMKIESTSSFFSIPNILFQKAIQDFFGDPQPFFQLKNGSLNDCLCRCYGVTRNEIQDLMLADTTTDLSAILNKTQATTGCGSCSVLIKKYLQSLKDQLQIIPGFLIGETDHRFDVRGQRVCPHNLTPFQLIPVLEEILSELKQNIHVKSLNGYNLELTTSGSNEGLSVDYIEKLLLEKLETKFVISFA